MKVVVSLCFLFISQILYAQNKGEITGQVLDDRNEVLEKATVSILKKQDSTLIAYTMTDDKGEFGLYKLPLNQDLTLVVSYVGFSVYYKDFTLISEETTDIGKVVLKGNVLEEVKINVQPPLRYNNDTLEYNANYFKTRPNATVEELIKKLPGLQVNLDGSIYYQGKEVNKVLINGKEFFVQDLRIATRNLEADMVSVVQVYRDKGESKRQVEDETTLPVTINLKFKKELLRADFGKFYGSGGTKDRYESGALVNTFRDTLQVSFIGFGNNINRQSFDYSELSQHGGMGRAENYGFSDFGGRNYGGVQNDISAGVNFNYDWGKTTKLNVMYQYAYGNTLNETSTEIEAFYDEGVHLSRNGSEAKSKKHRNTINGRFNHRFDTTAFLRFVPRIDFNKSIRGGENTGESYQLSEMINNQINEYNNDNNSLNYNHRLYFEKRFHPKVILSLNHNMHNNDDHGANWSEQLAVIYAESEKLKRRVVVSDNKTSDFSNKLNSNVELLLHKQLTVNVFVDYDFVKFKRDEGLGLGINDGGIEDKKDSENDLTFITRDYAVGTKFSWNATKDFNFTAGIKGDYKQNSFDYLQALPSREDKGFYWLPSFSMRFKSVFVSYARNMSHPPISSIRSVDNDLNEFNLVRAFPFAENILTDDARLNFNKAFNNYKTQVSINAKYSKRSYSFGYKVNQNLTTGRNEQEAYIAPSTVNFSLGSSINQRVKLSKNWNLLIREQLGGGKNEGYTIRNGVENKDSRWNGNIEQELTFSWKELLVLSNKYRFDYSKTTVSADDPNFRNSTNSTHSFEAGLKVNNVKRFTLETSYELKKLRNSFRTNPLMNIINLSLYYELKQNGQLKFTVFDLLNQNLSIHHLSISGSNIYHESNTLKQYFLLGYVYKFTKTKTK